VLASYFGKRVRRVFHNLWPASCTRARDRPYGGLTAFDTILFENELLLMLTARAVHSLTTRSYPQEWITAFLFRIRGEFLADHFFENRNQREEHLTNGFDGADNELELFTR